MAGAHRKFATMLAAVLLGNAMPVLAQDLPPFSVMPSSQAPHGEVEARFMGVTTTLFSNGADQILIDGFFSRPNAWRLTQPIRPRRAPISYALARAGIDNRLRAVLVAHSHHDHALDSAAVAARTGARLVGTASTRNIGLGGGLPDHRIDLVADGARLHFGGFQIGVIGSPHSIDGFFEDSIDARLTPPAFVSRYREGGNFAFLIARDDLNILVHPSANVIPGRYRALRVRADIVFLSIGTLGQRDERFAEEYWREVVLATCARLVVLTHWDNFMRGLASGLRPMPRPLDEVRQAARWIAAAAVRDGIEVRTMPLFEPVNLSRAVSPRPPAGDPSVRPACR